jgi:hypothetical protein
MTTAIRSNRAWQATVLIVVVAVGVVTGVLASSDGQPEVVEQADPVARAFADGSLDVCVWQFDGAGVDLTSVGRRLSEVKRSPAAMDGGYDELSERVRGQCSGRPGGGSAAFVTDNRQPREIKRQFALEATRGDNADMWLFVVPQATADSLGDEWRDRRIPWRGTSPYKGLWVETAGAILLGEEEASDPSTVRRALLFGLGIQAVPSGRPYVDGRCAAPDGKDCPPFGQ